MRTPGADEELLAGFLLAEGLIDGAAADLERLGPPDDLAANVVEARRSTLLAAARPARPRPFPVTAGCGVCGADAIAAISDAPRPVAGQPRVTAGVLAGLPARLEEHQRAFSRTGGLHAAGLFDAGGQVLAVREDVGRHNALDKVLGWAVREGRVPVAGALGCVSGRLSFELVQKAARAGLPLLAGVSAPSSLAVALAREHGITLCGFVRGGRMNVYASADRIA